MFQICFILQKDMFFFIIIFFHMELKLGRLCFLQNKLRKFKLLCMWIGPLYYQCQILFNLFGPSSLPCLCQENRTKIKSTLLSFPISRLLFIYLCNRDLITSYLTLVMDFNHIRSFSYFHFKHANMVTEESWQHSILCFGKSSYQTRLSFAESEFT